MRIGVISKADVTGGGASLVAVNLARTYRELSHEADHVNLTNSGPLHPYGRAAAAVIAFKQVEGHFGYRDHLPVERLTGQLKRLVRTYDAFHLHDMSTVYSHRSIAWLARRRPTLWTLHDCSPFTAGCLYPTECDRFETRCGDCPHLGSWPLSTRYDRTAELHRRRREAISKAPITFTAPSQWMIEQFKRAGHAAERIHHVPNAIDADVFCPVDDRAEWRKRFGIDETGGPVLCFSAAWLNDSRKGPDRVAQLCNRLRDLNPLLLLVGRYSEEAAAIFQNLNIKHFGFVPGDAERARIFSLADIGLMMSREENAPLVVLEYLACGVPVFGLPAGGVPDMVEDGKTGYIAREDGLDELEAAIRAMWPNILPALSENARAVIEAGHTYRAVSQTYLSILEAQAGERG